MTTSASGRQRTAACNGVTTVFAIPFQFHPGALRVYLLDAADAPNSAGIALSEGSDYVLSGDGKAGTASLTTAIAYPAGKYLRRWRETPRAQEADYVAGDGFPAETHEDQLDRLSLVDEELGDDIEGARGETAALAARAVLVAPGDSAPILPSRAGHAGKLLAAAAAGALAWVQPPATFADAVAVTDLAGDSGADMIGIGNGRSLADKLGDFVTLPDHRAVIDADDRNALAAALATGKRVYLPAGRGSGPGGVYLIEAGNGTNGGPQNLVSGAYLYGDGIGKTIVRKPTTNTASVTFYCNSGSADPANNLTDITIRDMTIEDDPLRSATDPTLGLGFSEHCHLIHANGVTRFRVENVEFKGFRGDAIYFGAGFATERHNYGLTVTGCHFDGINRNNRNGISVIDGQFVLIEKCSFRRTTRTGGAAAADPFNPNSGVSMPGAIDIEPDAQTHHRVRFVTIRSNRFDDCGGGAIALLIGQTWIADQPMTRFLIEDNVVRGCNSNFTISGYPDESLASASLPLDIRIARNTFMGATVRSFMVAGAYRAVIEDNLFVGNAHAIIGLKRPASGDLPEELWHNRELIIRRNQFIRDGHDNANVMIQDTDTTDCELSGNLFVDCGLQSGTASGRAWFVRSGGLANCAMVRFTVKNNTLQNPNSRMTSFVQMVGGWAGATTGSIKLGNNLNGVAEGGVVFPVRDRSYTLSNVVATRTFDADTVTLEALADVVGTLIGDIAAAGIGVRV